MQRELDAKSIQVKELNKSKAEIEKLKREKDELREAVNLEKEKEIAGVESAHNLKEIKKQVSKFL